MSELIVQTVEFTLEKHPNADTLSIAHIKGWQCVVRTEDFKNEQFGVYIPLDSICKTTNPLLNFLEGKKVKTIKLRGVISQGVLLPLSQVVNYLGFTPKLDENIKDHLGIVKYEAPLKMLNFYSGHVDTFHDQPEFFNMYTDIENWNNYPNIISDGEPVRITEKLHGTNARFGISSNFDIFVGSHKRTLRIEPYLSKKTLEKWNHRSVWTKFLDFLLSNKPTMTIPPDNIWIRVYRNYHIEAFLSFVQEAVYHRVKDDCMEKSEIKSVVVYGEIVGEGIQDLKYGHSDLGFYVFGITVDGKYLSPKDVDALLLKYNSFNNAVKINSVPVLFEGAFSKELLKLADGKDIPSNSHVREGIVIEALTNTFSKSLGRVVLKKVSDAYYIRKNSQDN